MPSLVLYIWMAATILEAGCYISERLLDIWMVTYVHVTHDLNDALLVSQSNIMIVYDVW